MRSSIFGEKILFSVGNRTELVKTYLKTCVEHNLSVAVCTICYGDLFITAVGFGEFLSKCAVVASFEGYYDLVLSSFLQLSYLGYSCTESCKRLVKCTGILVITVYSNKNISVISNLMHGIGEALKRNWHTKR